jgi:SAM-dependent methyltransferase
MRPGASVLEIGAGNGVQALELSRKGFQVVAVDLATSTYAAHRVFPIIDYDGDHLPFPNESFDIVISSNVLEHVHGFGGLMRESARVLKKDGYCVHAMPSPWWRLWTFVSGYADLPPYLVAVFTGRHAARRGGLIGILKGIFGRVLPISHGKIYPGAAELFVYRLRFWRKRFERHGFDVLRAEPMGLFYTGWHFRGRRMSIATRERLARWLGSACYLYVVRPRK